MSKRRKAWAAAIGLPAAFLLLAGGLTIGGVSSGFSASLNNSTNKIGTGTSFLTAKQAAATLCTSQPAGNVIPATSTFECSGGLTTDVLYNNGSKATTFINSGTQKFGSASFKLNSCSPKVLRNVKAPNNSLIARGELSWNGAAVSKLATSGSVGFNGTTGAGTSFSSSTGPQTYSVAAWFKSSTPQGGVFAWSNTLIASSASNYDRMLYFNSDGSLTFYTYPNSNKRVTTSGTNYADGQWHLGVVTATSGSGAKIELYVDNTYIGSTTSGVANSSQANTGYWQIGHAFGNNVGGAGSWFNGNISNVATFSNALTAADVATLWNQNTQSGYAATVNSLAVTNYWPLNEDGSYTVANYTSLSTGSYDPCPALNVTVGSSTECVYPAQASCPAVGSSSSLASLVSSGSNAFTSPASGSSTTLTLTTARNSNWNNSFHENINILVTSSIATTAFSQTFLWSK